MPPYLPVTAISRSQSVRLGHGPGNVVPAEISAAIVPYYADLGDPLVRRDLQRHAAVGAIVTVGTVSPTISSNLYRSSGLAVSAGSTTTVNLASGVVTLRATGATQNVGAITGIAVAVSDTTHDRWDLVRINNAGVPSVVTGVPAASPALPAAGSNFMPVGKVVVHANDSASSSYTYTTAYPTA